MKKNISLVLSAIMLLVLSCSRSDQPFAFYRQSHPQNFITVKGAELYAYTANDSALVRADYYLKLLGQINTYGDNIVHYGHCWHPTNPNPVIGIDSLMTRDPIDGYQKIGDNEISFISYATRLKANTDYYVRSYIITDKDTGYNPVVRLIKTKDAIDEWFPKAGDIGVERPGGARFDALGFNFGDTIIFGGGNQGLGYLNPSMWMYDPTTRQWNGDFAPLIQVTYSFENKGTAFADGIGFGIEFTDINAPIGKKARCIYVGLGDYVGDDHPDSKSRAILEYDFGDLVPSWKHITDFPGSRRSGAVSFVIGNRAYIGTGKGTVIASDWYVFYPELARDQNPGTLEWRVLENKPSNIGRKGAVAFTLNGRGYFGLGYDENGNFLKDWWEFRPNVLDATKGTWTKKADFPGLARANAVGFAIGDQGYVGTGDNILGDMESDPPTYTGEFFEDFYRYDPFNNRWFQMRDYTSNKTDRVNISKKVTRAVGFSSRADNIGYIGFGIVPDDPVSRAQEDIWFYRPFVAGYK